MMRSKWWLLVYALIVLLVVLSLGQWGTADRPWHNCQESLLQQFFSDECTPRRGLGTTPIADASTTEDSY